MGDIFDQTAAQMQGSSSGSSGATSPTAPSPAQQPQQQAAAPTGDIFDQVGSSMASQGASSGQAPATLPSTPASSPVQNTISAIPEPSGLGKIEQWANNVTKDIENGTNLTGVGSVLKAMGAHGVYNGNSKAVGDILGSIPLGLLKTIKGAAELPQTGKHVQGAEDLASGALQASQIPSAFVAPEAGELAGQGIQKAGEAASEAAGNITNTVGKVAGKAAGATIDAIRGPERAVQPALQGTLRQTLADVAAEHGITVPDNTAMRDVAEKVAQGVKAKGSALYKSIDNALGGTRFQTFDEQLDNVQQALRDDTGIDPDKTGKLIERLNYLEEAKANARQQAVQSGIDPGAFEQADGYWRQGSALQDLSKKIRNATSGLPENLANGSKEAATAAKESVSPSKLAPQIRALRDRGRLQQAIGEERADDLFRTLESANQRTQAIAKHRKLAGRVAGRVATGAAIGGAYDIGSHLIGGE